MHSNNILFENYINIIDTKPKTAVRGKHALICCKLSVHICLLIDHYSNLSSLDQLFRFCWYCSFFSLTGNFYFAFKYWISWIFESSFIRVTRSSSSNLCSLNRFLAFQREVYSALFMIALLKCIIYLLYSEFDFT